MLYKYFVFAGYDQMLFFVPKSQTVAQNIKTTISQRLVFTGMHNRWPPQVHGTSASVHVWAPITKVTPDAGDDSWLYAPST